MCRRTGRYAVELLRRKTDDDAHYRMEIDCETLRTVPDFARQPGFSPAVRRNRQARRRSGLVRAALPTQDDARGQTGIGILCSW